jgi:ABC-2 type transport system ATP-binding protein
VRGSAPGQDRVADSPNVLEAWGLAKRYNRRTLALAGIDLSIRRGSITALVGPNGAGKSTLIKAWVGFERPSAGRVAVAGVDPWTDRVAALAHIGYVPQTPALYRELTVVDHVDLAADLRGDPFDASIVVRRLDELDIPLDARAGELSGGQSAQVALALALGTRAEVLLLDEPLASLDPLARREFLHVVMDAVRSDGSTALLSSHVITDIEQACDHLVVLGSGRKLLDAPITEAVAAHAIADGDMAGMPGIIGSFIEADGTRISLVGQTSTAPQSARAWAGSRPATLEEVVLGYLASVRGPRQ